MKNISNYIKLLVVILIVVIIFLFAKGKTSSANEDTLLSLTTQNIINVIKHECKETKVLKKEYTDMYILSDGNLVPDLGIKKLTNLSGIIYVNDYCNLKVNIYNDEYRITKGYKEKDIKMVINDKNDFIKNLEFYYAGDSIIEGYGNNFHGIAKNLEETYGAYTVEDYSVSGSYLVKPAGAASIQTQIFDMVNHQNSSEDYGRNSVVIFNGGCNDFFNAQGLKITYDNKDNGLMDYSNALRKSFDEILSVSQAKQIEAPIIYVFPYVEMDIDKYNFWYNITKSIIDEYNNDNIILVKADRYLIRDDLLDDGIHVRESGYQKLAKVIYNILEEYYS